MTTIAWDGKTLAGDRQHSMFNGSAPKIFRLKSGDLFGACGQIQDAYAVREWLDGGEKPKVEDGFHAILIRFGELIAIENKLILMPTPRQFFAVGSGRDFAMAAMMLGKTAAEAVNIAALLDVDTGHDVDVLTIGVE